MVLELNAYSPQNYWCGGPYYPHSKILGLSGKSKIEYNTRALLTKTEPRRLCAVRWPMFVELRYRFAFCDFRECDWLDAREGYRLS